MVFAPRGRAKMSAVVLTLAATPALAESPAPVPQASADAGTSSITLGTIEVISQELNAARLQIQPSLGASTYYFGSEALETIPQGANAPLNQVLLQMPGVAQDSFGQIHVRGDHANVQFRINGVQLPEGLSVFGQALETRFARSISLLTGALPAQYGFLTAGVWTSRRRPDSPIQVWLSQCMAEASIGCSRASNMADTKVRSIGSSPAII